jgi:hypothetical protein
MQRGRDDGLAVIKQGVLLGKLNGVRVSMGLGNEDGIVSYTWMQRGHRFAHICVRDELGVMEVDFPMCAVKDSLYVGKSESFQPLTMEVSDSISLESRFIPNLEGENIAETVAVADVELPTLEFDCIREVERSKWNRLNCDEDQKIHILRSKAVLISSEMIVDIILESEFMKEVIKFNVIRSNGIIIRFSILNFVGDSLEC